MAEKSQLRRALRERKQLSDDDTDKIERTLREFREGRLAKREAARQLIEYVPEEEKSKLMGLDKDDLLPLVLTLIGGASMLRGKGGLGGMLNGLLGRDSSSSSSGSDFDLRDIVGNLLGGDNDSRSSGGLGGLLGGILGKDDDQTPRKRK